MLRMVMIGTAVVVASVIAVVAVTWDSDSSNARTDSQTQTAWAIAPNQTTAAINELRTACHEKALAYDPQTRLPDLARCFLMPFSPSDAIGRYPGSDFSGANFSGANLAGTNFSDSNFTGANLSGAMLGMEFMSSEFAGVNFTGATLTGARLANVLLVRSNFTDANLSGAYFYGFGILGNVTAWARIGNVIWNNTICPDGTNSDANNGSCADNIYLSPSHRPTAPAEQSPTN